MTRIAALALLLVACGSAQKQTENLLDTSTRFQEGMRWGRFEDAASHIPPADREAFLDEHDKLGENLRIDDYEVIRVHFKDTHEEALVQVKYSWHLDGEGIVKSTVTDQKWRLHGNSWWLEEETKKRGEDMPGVKAALPGPHDPHDPPADAPSEGHAEPPAPGGNASGDAAL